jgi:UPF0755 protein
LKKFFLSLLTLVVLLTSAAWIAVKGLKTWAQTPITVSKPVIISFPKEAKLDDLANSLYHNGAITHRSFFVFWVKYYNNYRLFQAGMYRFSGEVSPETIVNDISKGKTFAPLALQLTIPEGFTTRQVFERAVANKVGSLEEFAKLNNNKALKAELRITGKTFEGYLYPATYQFTAQPNAESFVRKMVSVFWQRLPPDYEKEVNKLGLTLHEAITFASLIEAETAQEDEKSQISEVIWKRLQKSEPLGIDAALIYGIPDYNGDIKTKHLKDSKNPYNTRLHKGLPPGPICSPTSSSLKAVLNPTKEGYYYYVLIPDQNRRHHFSRSIEEHNQHVQQLLRKGANK